MTGVRKHESPDTKRAERPDRMEVKAADGHITLPPLEGQDPVDHYIKEFDLIDANQDNVLTRQELRAALLRQDWETADIDDLFQLMDENRDNFVTRQEYIDFRSAVIFDAFAFRASRRISLSDFHELDARQGEVTVPTNLQHDERPQPTPSLLSPRRPAHRRSRELYLRAASALYGVVDDATGALVGNFSASDFRRARTTRESPAQRGHLPPPRDPNQPPRGV